MNESIENQKQAEGRTMERSLRKTRSDSRWNSLAPEQRETVEKWLFEDRISYAETVERLKKEFGMEISLMGISRFYRCRARIRRSIELLETQVDADKLGAMPVKTEELRAGAVKLLAKDAMALGVERPEDVEGLVSLTRVLLESEQNEIRLRKVKLEERYYDLEANTMCAKELEKVRGYLRTVGDNEYLSAEEKQQRVIGLIFGRDKVNVEELEEESAESVLRVLQRKQAGSATIQSVTTVQKCAAFPPACGAERETDQTKSDSGKEAGISGNVPNPVLTPINTYLRVNEKKAIIQRSRGFK
jgi:hypothetical protein